MKNIFKFIAFFWFLNIGEASAQNLVFSFSVVNTGSTSVVKIFVQNPSGTAENLIGFGTYFYFDNTETTLTSWSTAPLTALGWAPDQTNNYVSGTNPTVTITHTGHSEFNVIDNNLTGSNIPANSAQILVAEINFNHTTGSPAGGFGYLAATVTNNHPPLKYFNATNQYNVLVSGSAAQSLPVELIQFEAKPLETAIELRWSSATEADFAGYEIHRSTDSREFSKIGWMPGKGGGDYAYLDKEVRPVIHYYYRLNMVDIDGKQTYSEVRTAKLEGGAKIAGVVVSPNPAKKYLKVDFETTQFGQATLELINPLGQVSFHQNYELNEGPNSIMVAVAHQPAGSYLLRLKTVDGESLERVVIEK